jgi:pimeloyl-ACP methyl ester carboxylesterase
MAHSDRGRQLSAHLAAASAAAATALLLRKKKHLQVPLALLAGWELGSAIRKDKIARPNSADYTEAAPKLIRSAMVDGILMRWEQHGERHSSSLPIVLLHGLPTNPRVWRYVIPRIPKDNAFCLAWEQVGFGHSLAEGLGRDISIPKQAEYLHAWLRHQNITKAVFVAHDFGGGVLQYLIRDHPDLCAGMVLSDCVAYDNWPVSAVRTARSLSSLIELLPPAFLKPFIYAGLLNLGHNSKARREEATELYRQPYNSSIGPKAFAHQLRHFYSQDTMAVARDLPHLNLGVPVRVIWGEADPLGMASGERLAKDLGAPIKRIPGGRHFTPEDYPDVIAHAVRDVLDELVPLAMPVSANNAQTNSPEAGSVAS